MAGRGPAPRDPDRLSRASVAKARQAGMHIIEAEPVPQPPLPEFDVQVVGVKGVEVQEFVWPPRTREWWQMWADSPLSAEFTATDWSELLDTAVLHARYWRGDVKLAAELRLRVAKFGATPEDRARLRIQFAQADDADDKRKNRGKGDGPGGARDRRGPLKAV